MKTKRILALLLILVMLVPMIAACGMMGPSTPGADGTTAPTTTAGPTTAPVTKPIPPVVAYQYTAIEGLGDYTIVYPETATYLISDAANALAAAILEATGVNVTVTTDRVEVGDTVPATGKEILLGVTNREESIGALGLRDRDFFVTYKNERLALLANSEEALLEAIEFAKTTLLRDGALTYVVGGYHKSAEYTLDDITLLGASISDFTIVRDSKNIAVAHYIAEAIRALTGISLPVRTVQDAESAYEILVGDTGRPATSMPVAEGKFAVTASGTKLALYGDGELAAYCAAMHFVKTYLDGNTTAISVTPVMLDVANASLYTLNLPEELAPIEIENTMNNGGVMERFLKAKAELPDEVTVLDPLDINNYPLSLRRKQLYVDPDDGDDANPGSIDKPLATLKAAVDRMTAGGGVIWLREGTHEIHEVVKLTDAVSGTPSSPLFIKAYGDEKATVTTFKEIKNEWFRWIEDDDPMYDRFDEDVDLQSILYADLADYGFTKDDITEIVSASDGYGANRTSGRTGATPILIIGGSEYNLARYPNADEPQLSFAYAYDTGRVTASTASELYDDWLTRVATSGETFEGEKLTNTSPVPWTISLGERNQAQQNKSDLEKYQTYKDGNNWERYAPILNWIDTGNIWFYGRPYADWDVGRYPVNVGIQPDGSYACYKGDSDKPAIFSQMPSALGASTKDTANHAHEYYLFNAIEALDIPGEWFIDEESEGLRLYIYPPDEFYAVDSFSYTASYTGSVIDIDSASNVVIDGLNFQGIGTMAITHETTSPMISDIVIQNCSFRNLGRYGINMTGQIRKVAVIYSSFGVSHGGMLKLSNTFAQSLVPDHNLVQNCTFGDPVATHQLGIEVNGCQSVISHNFLTDTNINLKDHAYECIVEYNRCDGGSRDVGDGGMVYMYGLYVRGCHTRYNVLHGGNYTGQAIYNDGMCSGNYAYYNIGSFLTGYRESAQKGHYVSSGHGNVCFNNIFIVRTWQRYEENVTAHGRTPMEPQTTMTSSGTTVNRVRGDMAMYESTLFYADLKDKGYEAGSLKREDAASYSWDTLYRGAAGRFSGTTAYQYADLEKFSERFPLFIEEMKGAWAVFRVMDEAGKDYDRRDAVVALEDKYDAAVVDTLVERGVLDADWVANRTAELMGTNYSNADAEAKAKDELRKDLLHYDEKEVKRRTNELMNECYSPEDALRKARKEARNVNTVDAESLKLADVAAFRLGYAYTEDYYRQPAYNVYLNNVVLGGDIDAFYDHDHDGIGGEDPSDFVNSDYLGNTDAVDDAGNIVKGGDSTSPFAKDLRIIGNNYYNLDWTEVFVNCDVPSDQMSTADYTFCPGALESIREAIPEQEGIPGFYNFVDHIWNRWKGK
ncbi:MAG: right-handed parallel beta-helix repeat-containing protein [Clostridia bacterium]|nr:right-handed parallel beta-helix repeat-containing protein [Clostridia bacterium]